MNHLVCVYLCVCVCVCDDGVSLAFILFIPLLYSPAAAV